MKPPLLNVKSRQNPLIIVFGCVRCFISHENRMNIPLDALDALDLQYIHIELHWTRPVHNPHVFGWHIPSRLSSPAPSNLAPLPQPVGSAPPAALRAAPPSTTEPPCSLPGTRDPRWSWGNCFGSIGRYGKIWETMNWSHKKNIACFFASRGTSTCLGGKIYRKPVFDSSNIRVFLQMLPSTNLWTNEKSWANPIDAFCNSWYAVGLSNGTCLHSVDANPSILR